MDFSWTTFAGIALGIGLAAATGIRVFLPLLIAGLAAHQGYIPLSENFQWLASTPALLMLGTAAVTETLAYYVPGLDHLLDVIASPAALVAGAVASAAVMTDLPPGVMWPLAIIGGSGHMTLGGRSVITAALATAPATSAAGLAMTSSRWSRPGM